MTSDKQLRAVTGHDVATGARVSGYEMHLGASTGPATARPMIRFDNGATDGAICADGRISGCHIHGLFNDAAFRTAFLATLNIRSSGENYPQRVEESLDAIAATLARTLNIDALSDIAELERSKLFQ